MIARSLTGIHDGFTVPAGCHPVQFLKIGSGNLEPRQRAPLGELAFDTTASSLSKDTIRDTGA